MIETIIRNWLLSHTESIGVYMEVPENPPEQYVIIERTGGTEENHIQRATVAIQSYAPSMFKAAGLNEIIKTAMASITEHESVSACQLNSDYNYTDTEKHLYRYQAVFDITYMN